MNLIESEIKDPFGDDDTVRCKIVSNERAFGALGRECPKSKIKTELLKDLEFTEFTKFKQNEENKKITTFSDGEFEIFSRDSFQYLYDNYDNIIKDNEIYFLSINLSDDHMIPKYNRLYTKSNKLVQYDYLQYKIEKKLFKENKRFIIIYEQTKKYIIHCHILIILPLNNYEDDITTLKMNISDDLEISKKDMKKDVWFDANKMNTKQDLYNIIQYLINKKQHIYEVENWKILKPFKNIIINKNNDEVLERVTEEYNIQEKYIKQKPEKVKKPKKTKIEKEIEDINKMSLELIPEPKHKPIEIMVQEHLEENEIDIPEPRVYKNALGHTVIKDGRKFTIEF